MDDYRAASLHGWSSVATDWAQLTERIDRQLRAAADWMIDELALEPGERVLELAGGPGTVSMIAARAVTPGGHVIYSDFAEPMLDAARERLQGEGAPGVEYRVIDAETIDLPDASVEAVACRMGYMLMADAPGWAPGTSPTRRPCPATRPRRQRADRTRSRRCTPSRRGG